MEVDCDGHLTLTDEDEEGWDTLIGAIHWLPSSANTGTPAEAEASFLRVVEQLLGHGIDILAHPFRCFHYLYGDGGDNPVNLHRPLARMLAEANVAAEINCSWNMPDPAFFEICLEEGARLAVGSDAHELSKVGDLYPHLRLLQQIGAPLDSIVGV